LTSRYFNGQIKICEKDNHKVKNRHHMEQQLRFQRVALWESDAALLPGKLQIKDLFIQEPASGGTSSFRFPLSNRHVPVIMLFAPEMQTLYYLLIQPV